jgi:hypothetical protein
VTGTTVTGARTVTTVMTDHDVPLQRRDCGGVTKRGNRAGPKHTFRVHFRGRQADLGLAIKPVTVGLAIGDEPWSSRVISIGSLEG